MQATRTLLEGVVDFAGLFPPAKLDMAATVRNYHAYRAGGDVWMLGRLVVPVARLAEFEAAAAPVLPKTSGAGEDDEAWPIAALTAAASDPQFRIDLDLIAAFNERHSAVGAGSAVVDVIEVKAGTVGEIDLAIDELPDEVFPYFEIAVDRDPRGLSRHWRRSMLARRSGPVA
ncbi:MAG: hypothetical protein SGJ09_08055 [Phycisphaerae bacterium]|nr:hypothetical protein [Phycisphaerae bacterium]